MHATPPIAPFWTLAPDGGPAHDDPSTPADAITRAARTQRPAPYRLVHQGLRVLMSCTLLRCGPLDAGLAEERASLVGEVERLLVSCTAHLARESRFLHDPLRACAPRAVVPFHDDHVDHLASMARLHRLLQRLRDAGPGDAPALGRELFLRLSVFVGENLEHMAEEESVMTLALWAHFSDAEIEALQDALLAALSPHELDFHLHWAARGMNAEEAAAALAGARARVAPELHARMVATVQAAMPAARWARVARALDLPPVPGLVTA